MGVGAAFDFISGNRPRAPMWMQASGLEWVHRMVHDPIKLAPPLRGGEHACSSPARSPRSPATRSGQPARPGDAVRVLVVHNRYRSAQPSGENAVVEEETALLRGAGAGRRACSRSRATRSPAGRAPKRLTLPGRVVWSRDGRPDWCGERSPGFRPGRRPLPQHLPAAQPRRAPRRARHRRPRRPDAPQLPPALPGRDVPPRRPRLRGVPRAASRSRRSSTAATAPRASPRCRSP